MAQKRKLHEVDTSALSQSLGFPDFVAELEVTDAIAKAFDRELLPSRINISSEARVTMGALTDLLSKRHSDWHKSVTAYNLFTLNSRDDDKSNLEAARLLKEAHDAENRYLVQRVFFERLVFRLEGLVMYAENEGAGVIPWSDVVCPWTKLLSRGIRDVAHPDRIRDVLEESSGRRESNFLLDGITPDVVVCNGAISGNMHPPGVTIEKSERPPLAATTGGARAEPMVQ